MLSLKKNVQLLPILEVWFIKYVMFFFIVQKKGKKLN